MAICAYAPPPLLRSILKPVSFDELSVHVRLIWLVETAVAARFDGAAGVPPPPPTGDGIAVPLCFSTSRSPPLPSTITRPSETYVYRGRIPSLYASRVG